MNQKQVTSLFVVLSIAVTTMTAISTNAYAEKQSATNQQRYQWGFENGCKGIIVSGGHSDSYNAGFTKGQSGQGCKGTDISGGDGSNTQAQDATGNPECVQHCHSSIGQSQANAIPATGQSTPQPATTTANPSCKFICF